MRTKATKAYKASVVTKCLHLGVVEPPGPPFARLVPGKVGLNQLFGFAVGVLSVQNSDDIFFGNFLARLFKTLAEPVEHGLVNFFPILVRFGDSPKLVLARSCLFIGTNEVMSQASA